MLRSPSLRSLTPAIILGIAFVALTAFVRRTVTSRELSLDRSLTARTPANFIDLSHAVDIQHWVFVVLGLAIVLALLRRYRQAILLIVAGVLADGLNAVLKIAVDRQAHPGSVTGAGLDQLDVLLFPSGHVVRASVTVGLLVLFLAWPHARARLPATVAALGLMALIGVTQVAVGGHLPLDAVGGYLLAGVIVNVIYVVDRALAAPVEPRPIPSEARHIKGRAWLASGALVVGLLVAAVVIRGDTSRVAQVPTTAAAAIVAHLSHPRVLLARIQDLIE